MLDQLIYSLIVNKLQPCAKGSLTGRYIKSSKCFLFKTIIQQDVQILILARYTKYAFLNTV